MFTAVNINIMNFNVIKMVKGIVWINGEKFEFSKIRELNEFKMRKRIEKYNRKYPNGTFRIGFRKIFIFKDNIFHKVVELSYEIPKRNNMSIYTYNKSFGIRFDFETSEITTMSGVGGLYDKVYKYNNLESFLRGCRRHSIPDLVVIEFLEHFKDFINNMKFEEG